MKNIGFLCIKSYDTFIKWNKRLAFSNRSYEKQTQELFPVVLELPILITPSKVPPRSCRAHNTFTFGEYGDAIVQAAIPSMQIAIIRSKSSGNLSTRNPPITAPTKNPRLLPDIARDTLS